MQSLLEDSLFDLLCVIVSAEAVKDADILLHWESLDYQFQIILTAEIVTELDKRDQL